MSASRIERYTARAKELAAMAEDARRQRDGHLAAVYERDSVSFYRMAREEAMVEAGTHYWHPLTCRLLPRE